MTLAPALSLHGVALMRLEIWIGDKLIGWLSTDDASRQLGRAREELERTSTRTREVLPAVVEAALAEGANAEAARRVQDVVLEKAAALQHLAKDLLPTARGARA